MKKTVKILSAREAISLERILKRGGNIRQLMQIATSGGFEYERELLDIVDREVENNEQILNAFFQSVGVREDPLKVNADFDTRELWIEVEDADDESGNPDDSHPAGGGV